MKTAAKTLVITLCAALTVIVLLAGLTPPQRDPAPAASALPAVPDSPAAPASGGVNLHEPAAEAATTVAADDAGKYYFDVVHHSAEEFAALMARAHAIYEQTPADQRDRLSIVLVIHGPDIDFFRRDNYSEHQSLVDSAARLDAFGVFDFKVCARTAARRGISEDDVPDFVEFVPYGPDEIDELKDRGYMRL